MKPTYYKMASLTVPTETVTKTEQEPSPSVTLKLRKPKSDKKVNWKEGTVDNEDMGKKKSKCCCIYQKPHTFDESSSSSGSDDDEDCKMCKHQKKGKQHTHKNDDPQHQDEH